MNDLIVKTVLHDFDALLANGITGIKHECENVGFPEAWKKTIHRSRKDIPSLSTRCMAVEMTPFACSQSNGMRSLVYEILWTVNRILAAAEEYSSEACGERAIPVGRCLGRKIGLHAAAGAFKCLHLSTCGRNLSQGTRSRRRKEVGQLYDFGGRGGSWAQTNNAEARVQDL